MHPESGSTADPSLPTTFTSAAVPSGGTLRGGLTADDLITLNEEIAGMARAGLPLDRGLAAMAREMGYGRLRNVTAALAEDLRSGLTLPQALDRQAGRVPPFYAGLVSAGIRTGRICEVLATLTAYARTVSDVRSVVLGALFYPFLVITIALVLFGLLFFYIVPQFEKIFSDFKLALPVATRVLLEVGRHPWQFLVMPIVGLVAGVTLTKLTLGRSPWGKRAWTRFVYAIPIAGTLIRSARLAAFSDLMGILIDHEVPLPEAFRLAGSASSDPIVTHSTRQVYEDLRQGRTLSEALQTYRLVPELIAWMTALGERRGNLGPTLHQVAEVYRRQVEMRASLLRNVLPAFFIVGTAVVMIGLFIVMLGLPLFQLLNGLSGGFK